MKRLNPKFARIAILQNVFIVKLIEQCAWDRKLLPRPRVNSFSGHGK